MKLPYLVVYSMPLIINMFQKYKFTAAERFIRYVQIDTQSDPLSSSHPTIRKTKGPQ